MMMFTIAMVERPGANAKGKDHHSGFKGYIMDNINAE